MVFYQKFNVDRLNITLVFDQQKKIYNTCKYYLIYFLTTKII